jgi:hypothetical protein
VAELIAELGSHLPERWEEVHERHRSHYASTRSDDGIAIHDRPTVR